jgi:phage portal protein BeeE
LQVGFASIHQGVENANRIGVLSKDEWQSIGANPKDMDFKNLSEESKERILMMFGTSKTILGTAEADTNRATAETAGYVFSKRVIKPHMMLICATLNERLIPRYGDDLYISFIDPVPEDRAARTTEMQATVGSQPILTVNEARDQFMGWGRSTGVMCS